MLLLGKQNEDVSSLLHFTLFLCFKDRFWCDNRGVVTANVESEITLLLEHNVILYKFNFSKRILLLL